MAKLFQKTCKMTNIDKQTEDNFQERIIEMAKALSDLQDRAVIEYSVS